MNALSEEYTQSSFVTLAFPCNQFGLQQPEANDEILNGVMYVRPGHGFVPNKKIYFFSKTQVNGGSEDPLFTSIKASCPPTTNNIGITSELYWTPIKANDIYWNWNKFLLDKNGMIRYRFGSAVTATQLKPWIDQLLNEK
uniref:Glutathione peroxidase n=2 Tax=Ciona intestinalis TaxID=7719 RepID=F7AGI1_CIOIN